MNDFLNDEKPYLSNDKNRFFLPWPISDSMYANIRIVVRVGEMYAKYIVIIIM